MGKLIGGTKAFRSAYGKLGEMRAKLKSSVPVIAMTATATSEVRRNVADSLGLRNYALLSRSPERSNIKHVYLQSKTKDFDKVFELMVKEVQENDIHTERTIIYCQSRRVVSDLFAMFRDLLPSSHHKYVQMYHTNTEADVQERIIDSFGDTAGEVRILVATIANGMGVDLKQVYRTIICGRTSDLDDYMQRSGRIGRDGKQSVAVTLRYPGDIRGRILSSTMKDFVGGKECHRSTIRRVFGEGNTSAVLQDHDCCDICASSCTCDGSRCSARRSFLETSLQQAVAVKEHGEELPLLIASPAQVTNLERALDGYRSSLLPEDEGHVYSGADIACGFPLEVGAQIVKDCNVHFNFHSFVARYNFPSSKIASEVWEIMCACLGRVGIEEEDIPANCTTCSNDESEESYSESEYQEAHCSDIE
ncbi:Werner syndrome ATP-dependent helicase-like [Lytechinus variegatus]|uniref:Werner syndrome ATP-dependent helicase-like n=1 Tax=Lytechinus variegatus TaxID=7654 RepID=UPI001BB14CEF|nr:Werner syndrome ATP-dependent helicase-like [Lytechinus variegatus]